MARLHVGAKPGVVGHQGAVDESVVVVALGRNVGRLEIGRRGGGGPHHLGHGEIVALAPDGPPGLEEEGDAPLDLVARDQDVDQRLRQPGIAEQLAQHVLQTDRRVLAVGQVAHGADLMPDRARKHLRAEDLVELHHLAGAVARPPVVARHQQPQGDQRAGRGAGDEIEQIGDRLVGAALQLGQHHGRQNAANATAVDGQDAHRAARPTAEKARQAAGALLDYIVRHGGSRAAPGPIGVWRAAVQRRKAGSQTDGAGARSVRSHGSRRKPYKALVYCMLNI